MNCITYDGKISINKSIIDFGGKIREVLSSPAFKHLHIKGFSRPQGKKSVVIELLQDPKMNEYVEIEGATVRYDKVRNAVTVFDGKPLTNEAAQEEQLSKALSSDELPPQETEEVEEIQEPAEESSDELPSQEPIEETEEIQEPTEETNLPRYVLKFNKGDKLSNQPAGIYNITMSKNVDYILTIDVDGGRSYITKDEENISFKSKLKTMTAVSRSKKSK